MCGGGYLFEYLPCITKTEKFFLYVVIHLKIMVDLLYINIFL